MSNHENSEIVREHKKHARDREVTPANNDPQLMIMANEDHSNKRLEGARYWNR